MTSEYNRLLLTSARASRTSLVTLSNHLLYCFFMLQFLGKCCWCSAQSLTNFYVYWQRYLVKVINIIIQIECLSNYKQSLPLKATLFYQYFK